tara:strand:- start:3640 stop:4413 length:774 start_codon:yes stop_codon:yes gene_type:complete
MLLYNDKNVKKNLVLPYFTTYRYGEADHPGPVDNKELIREFVDYSILSAYQNILKKQIILLLYKHICTNRPLRLENPPVLNNKPPLPPMLIRSYALIPIDIFKSEPYRFVNNIITFNFVMGERLSKLKMRVPIFIDSFNIEYVWTKYSIYKKQYEKVIELDWSVDLYNGDLVRGNDRWPILVRHSFSRIECSIPLFKSIVMLLVLSKRAKRRLKNKKFICTILYREFSWRPAAEIASYIWKDIKIKLYLDTKRYFKI